jgi:hypothetical protein
VVVARNLPLVVAVEIEFVAEGAPGVVEHGGEEGLLILVAFPLAGEHLRLLSLFGTAGLPHLKKRRRERPVWEVGGAVVAFAMLVTGHPVRDLSVDES